MKGYIYTMYAGADPGHGWILNDPIFGSPPTLGACVPHIRRSVELGDYVFAISGRVPGEKQFVVGGFKVAEKIDALAAFERFPGYRMTRRSDGSIEGNIIVDSDGSQVSIDSHSNFAARVKNYIVGGDPIVLETESQVDVARAQTIQVLQDVFGRPGKRVFDIIGRHRKMTDKQVQQLIAWMETIKR